ncbi:MAG: zinc ribbon domain-containing protein [Planctomycetota bacterium]|nr:zinc ribbon domain-containing protein [Planctomycetota bacterium]
MPLYEYICEADGETIELLRPMSQADAPVPDPKALGRVFTRKQSTFAASGIGTAGAGGGSLPMAGGCCPCGKNVGGCRSMNN